MSVVKVCAFCFAVAAIAFRLGWELSDRLSSYAEELDPRIEGKYGW